MKSIILFIFLTISFSVHAAEFKEGVINDIDGYVNVREQPQGNARVVGKLYDYEGKFDYIPSNTSSWWYIEHRTIKGYVHKSRISPYKIQSDANSCECSSEYFMGEKLKPAFSKKVGNTDLSACGSVHQSDGKNKVLLDTFALQNCSTGELLMDAQGYYIYHFMEYTNDGVVIQESPILPTGKGWREQRYPLIERRGQEVNGVFTLSDPHFVLPEQQVTAEEIASIKASVLTPMPNIGEHQLYDLIERLFVCTLLGDDECHQLLKGLRDYYSMDGGMAEYHFNFLRLLDLYDAERLHDDDDSTTLVGQKRIALYNLVADYHKAYQVNPNATEVIQMADNIKNADVSGITDLSNLFNGMTTFNLDISSWDTSSVNTMYKMFYGAKSFNQDIGQWDTSRVINMAETFSHAESFNQDIGNWDVSHVKNMSFMFNQAFVFDQNLNKWNTGKVTNMRGMFTHTHKFNGDISTWDVSQVTNMREMFLVSSLFNSDINTWDVSQVTTMRQMFTYASAFNSDISNWKTSNVRDMYDMFDEASSFNQDISAWDMSSVKSGYEPH